MSVSSFARTLDQELQALVRGVSLECPACGEFVLHGRGGVIACAECGSSLADGRAAASAPPQQQRLPAG